MTTTTDWATQVHKAADEMAKAKTKDDVEFVWKNNIVLGHRLLGRLLIGWTPEKIIERHES